MENSHIPKDLRKLREKIKSYTFTRKTIEKIIEEILGRKLRAISYSQDEIILIDDTLNEKELKLLSNSGFFKDYVLVEELKGKLHVSKEKDKEIEIEHKKKLAKR